MSLAIATVSSQPIPFPAPIVSGNPLITVGFAHAGQSNLEPETLQVIAASSIPVTPAAMFLLNNAILTWKSLGVIGPALQIRVAELQSMIAGGYVLWSQFGVSPSNPDNGPAFSSLPTGMLVLADTPGNLTIASQWVLQSNLFVVSDFSNVLISTFPGFPVTDLSSFFFGLLGQPQLKIPGPSPGSFPMLNSIYLFGINVQCTNVNTSYSVFCWNANNVQLLHFTANNYASLIFCVGANVEIAYGNCTTIGAINPIAGGGPGVRCLGTTAGTVNPVPTSPGRAASFWVHDCYMESYDGLYQLGPNVVQWGSNLNFVNTRFENLSGISRDGPLVLISASTRVQGNYNITDYTFINISAVGFKDGLALHNYCNVGNSWSGGLFQNILIDVSNETTFAPAAIEVSSEPSNGLPAGIINDITFRNCHVVGTNTDNLTVDGAQIVGPILFDRCQFDIPNTATNRYGLRIVDGASNITFNNCYIGITERGFDIGTSNILVTGTSASTDGHNEIVLALNSSQGVAAGHSVVVSGVGGTTEANNGGAQPATWTVRSAVGTTVAETIQLQGSTFVHAWTSGGGVEDLSIPPSNNIVITGCTFDSVQTSAGVGILFEQVNAATVQNNTLLKGPGGNPPAFLTTVAAAGQPGTTNCIVTNNSINGLATPTNSATPDAQGNVFNNNI